MKVLVGHSAYRQFGGEDRYFRSQLELLSRRHEVVPWEVRNDQLGKGSAAVRMTFSPAMTRRAKSIMKSERPDVVHLHNVYPSIGPAAHLAAKSLGIPVVATVHNHRLRCPNGYQFTEGQLCRRCEKGNYSHAVVHRCFESRSQAAAYAASLWLHRVVVRLDRFVDVFVAPSVFVAERLARWGIAAPKIRIVRHFVAAGPRASGGVGRGGIFAGRLSSEKGLDVLLKALAEAGDPLFRIVGDGPLREDLRSAALSLGLSNTRFYGHVEAGEVLKLMAEARYVVSPSIWEETAGLAAMEAMALGRAAIVSSLGALPELVQPDRGIETEAGNPVALGAAIRLLDEDPDLAARLGANSWEFCRTDLSAEAHLVNLSRVYSEVAGNGARG